jgi:arginine:pyruvate transaminase
MPGTRIAASPALAARAGAMVRAGALAAWDVPARAAAMRAAGKQVILLTLGDPEGPPHPAIVQAAARALEAGRTHYAPLPGEPALRAAIAAHLGCTPEQVTVMPGAQAGVFAAVQLVAGPGDAVLLSDPTYATYPGVVAASGAAARMVATRPGDFALDHDALARAVTPEVRAILLASPANPTGAALGADDFERLGALAEAHDLWLIVDETYRHFAFAGAHVSALSVAPPERTILVGTLSKSHAMTGFRLGWVVAPAALAQAFEEWCAAATFGVAQFVQDAGVAALALPEAELAPWRAAFRARAAHMVARLNAMPGIAARMPEGGMFVMADVRARTADDTRLALRLLEHERVAVLPGSAFGPGGAGYLRLSLTPDLDTLDRALDRVARFLCRKAGFPSS